MDDRDSMGREYAPEFKASVVDEALRGERDVNAISAEHQLGTGVLRRWLLEHYNQNPNDKRRHLVVRGDRSPSANEGNDDEGETQAREPMAKKRERAIPLETKKQIVKELLSMHATGKSAREIADAAGVHETTVSFFWQCLDPDYQPTDPAKRDRAVAMLREGKTRTFVSEKLGIGKQLLHIWAIRAGIPPERKSDAVMWLLKQVRKQLGTPEPSPVESDDVEVTDTGTRLSRPQPPASRQQSLALSEQTRGPVSAPRSYAAPSSYAAPPMPRPPERHYMSPPSAPMGNGVDLAADALHEALEERHTLRKMLDIVQREKAVLERENQELRARLANA